MTKKQIGIWLAVVLAVAATMIVWIRLPEKEQPYVWGGFAEERREIKSQVEIDKQTYDVVRMHGSSNAIVSVWQNGRQIGKNFFSPSTSVVELARQALRGEDK